jgi:hypothetical protein
MPGMSAAPQPDANTLVLHTLRCVGFTTVERVAEAAGLDRDDAESELIDLGVDGLVEHLKGDFGGWGLTAAGRKDDAERVARELDEAGARAGAGDAYERFMVLNPELLDLCTAWQTGPDGALLNDHDDPDYDGRVLARFGDLDQRVGEILDDLTELLPRFGRYRDRLGLALARARSGELEYVTDSTASYHSVWFQLHEDLLVTLGRPRT